MSNVLQTEGVSMRFQKVEALNEVSLSVAPGERVALLGHNGAGKTTLFRIVLGFLKPESGVVLVDGVKSGTKHANRFHICPRV